MEGKGKDEKRKRKRKFNSIGMERDQKSKGRKG